MRARTGGTEATSRALRALVTVLAFALSPCAGEAEVGEEAGMIDELLHWIGKRGGLEVDTVRAAPPRILIADVGEWLGSDKGGFEVAVDWAGAWDPELGAIVLVWPWSAGDLFDRSVLLHELVHAVQSANGRNLCDPLAEREAYSLQARWLAERGTGLLVDWEAVRRRSACTAESGP